MKPSFNLKRNPSNLIIFSGLILVTIFLIGSGVMYRSTEGQIQNLENIRNGAHICSSRTGQSFFAVANGQFSSSSIGAAFLSKTDDCFHKVSERAKGTDDAKITAAANLLYDKYISFKNAIRNGR